MVSLHLALGSVGVSWGMFKHDMCVRVFVGFARDNLELRENGNWELAGKSVWPITDKLRVFGSVVFKLGLLTFLWGLTWYLGLGCGFSGLGFWLLGIGEGLGGIGLVWA